MTASLRDADATLERKLDLRTRELANALEQQSAISEILQVISSSPTDVAPVLHAVAQRAARLCDAPYARVMVIEGDRLRPMADYSIEPVFSGNPVPLSRTSVTGRAVTDRTTVHVADVVPITESEFPDAADNIRRLGCRAVLAVPLLREGGAYGGIFLFRREPGLFSPDQVELVQTFARQAAIAIDNVRLFNETKEALEKQTAISEILRVISASPTDVQPVFDIIGECAEKLCDAEVSVVSRVEGEAIRLAAVHGVTAEARDAIRTAFPMNIDDETVTSRAIRNRAVEHVPDVLEDPAYAQKHVATLANYHAGLGVPMLREGQVIGAIFVARTDAGSFRDSQVELLKTFADQAAIAIENVRLFNETQQALQQQTAIAEILRVISSSPTDIQPVLDAIAERAARLCDASAASMYLIDGDVLRHLASKGPSPDPVGHVESLPIDNSTLSGRALIEGRGIQVADMLAEAATYPQSHAIAERFHHRTVIVLPLYREGQPVGTILLRRQDVRPFSDREIALLQTFGDQAAIALENVRLFREIQDKSRELEIANQHKSEFLANMSHELRTPLNAIIGFSEVLLERMFGEVNDKQADYLEDIHSSGRHLLNLINDILDLSKVEAGRMELDLGAFDLPTAIGNAIALIRERAQKHAITLNVQLESGLADVVADERKLKQILLNLLSNAVKFTPDGGRIHVGARRAGHDVEVAIEDTGIGIAATDHAAVFDEFRQVGRQYTSKHEGTGLGLALTRRFVELHGGTIRVDSELGKGSIFTFTLPQPMRG